MITLFVPEEPVKVPLAPAPVPSVPFGAPLTDTASSEISPALHWLVITRSRIEDGGTFDPVIAIMQLGACGEDSTILVGGTLIAVSGMVTGCGEGLIRSTTATRITTIMIPPIMRYGVRELFSFRTTRQFGQTVRFDSTGAPQCGQVLFAIYFSCFIPLVICVVKLKFVFLDNKRIGRVLKQNSENAPLKSFQKFCGYYFSKRSRSVKRSDTGDSNPRSVEQ
jgi:hypothetical protein